MTLSAEELYRRGVDHGNAGRNAAARRSLAAALRRTDDPDLRARIAGTLSYVAGRTGDPSGAERLCRDALAVDGVSPATAAILHGQLGLLAVGRGELETAVVWLDKAIAGIGDDPVHRNSMYLNRSVAHMQSGRFRQARADLERAAADFALVGNEQDVAMARHNLGYVALLEGDLVAALEDMSAARAVMQAGSAVNTAIGDLDRAEVLRDAGLTTEAEQTLERVARTFGAHRMRQARGEAEFNLARSLLAHDPARAATVAAAAARRFRSLHSRSWAARSIGLRMRAELAGGQFRRSGAPVAGPARVPSPDEVAEAAAELDRLGFALDAAGLRMTLALWQARHGADPGPPQPVPRRAPVQLQLLAHEVRATRAAAAGRNGEARRHAGRGLDALGQWQRSFGSLDLQTSLSMHGQGLILEGVGAAVRSGRPDLVFDWSERARHLSQQVVPLRPPPDPELAEDLAELRALRAEDPAGDWLAEPRAAALRDRARHRQWTTTGAAGLDERVGLEELRAALDPDTAFAAYVFGGDTLTALVATDTGTRLFGIGAWRDVAGTLAGLRADLDVSASVRSGPMAPIVAGALAARLAELAEVLTDGLLEAIGERRLVLTTPGVLAGVPWPMLPGLRGRPFTLATSATR
ncbi:MAG: tetratricopeptide repeat protein, partial [Propionicimonas sp.]|nr:tetratricopeptide repeat protein [Propionicimonas sp.]